MADNFTTNAGSGGDTFAADDISGIKHQRVKIQYGIDGAATDVSDTNPLPIDDAGGSLTVDGTVAVSSVAGTVVVDGSGVTQPVSGTVTANAGTNLNTSALALESGGNLATIAGDTTSLDGKTVADKSADFDTGAGTDTVKMAGIALPKSGGAVAGGTSTDPIRTDPTGTTTQPISASSLPLPTGAAQDSTLTNKTQLTKITDGTLDISLVASGLVPTVPVVLMSGGTDAMSSGALATEVTASLPAGTNNIGDVDVVSSALPTGAATSAKQDTGNTSLSTIAGVVSGTEMQVDIVASLPAGTNAIGKLAANSGVDIGDVDVTSQPARDRTTDNQGVALQTDALMNDTTVLTPKFAVIDAATSGDNTIVAAVTGKKIRVLSYTIVAAGDVTVRFEDGASGTALTGQMNLTTNSGVSCAFSPVGHFETTAATLLNMELSAATSVDGHLTYIEV